ncbi:MAG: condensation domain-containing protein, partial [Steroidobacteraceae bacterium]
MLCSVFEDSDGQPRQRIRAAWSAAVTHEEWPGRRPEEAVAWLNARAREPLPLTTGPLIRVHLVSLSEAEHYGVVVVHHIVFDGSSWLPLWSTILEAYGALSVGAAPQPTACEATYQEFVDWEQRLLRSEEAAEHRAYWLRQLGGRLGLLELPSDRPRLNEAMAGRTIRCTLDSAVHAAIKRECRALAVTPAVYLLSLYQLLLNRYTGEPDVMAGMPSMGRPQARFANTVGYFINMIAVRTRIDAAKSFAELVRAVNATVANGVDHGMYPFPTVVRDLNAPRGRAPIFQCIYSYVNASLFERSGGSWHGLGPLRVEPVEAIGRDVHFNDYELELEVRERADSY